jgi:predicted nucleic acid-binding protein
VSVVVDSSALFALLDADDPHHAEATRYWDEADQDLVTHAYVIVETVAIVRRRWGWDIVDRLVDDLLPALRVELIDRATHDEALADYRARHSGASLVDRVTIAFARRVGITTAFAFDRDFTSAGLPFPQSRKESE